MWYVGGMTRKQFFASLVGLFVAPKLPVPKVGPMVPAGSRLTVSYTSNPYIKDRALARLQKKFQFRHPSAGPKWEPREKPFKYQYEEIG